jgi:transposase-like protein
MARRYSPRHPLFRQRWFADDIIITCVRWYLRFKLSYRDLAELARELGVSVAPSTVLRWVIRYVPEDSDLPQGRRSMDVPLPRR